MFLIRTKFKGLLRIKIRWSSGSQRGCIISAVSTVHKQIAEFKAVCFLPTGAFKV